MSKQENSPEQLENFREISGALKTKEIGKVNLSVSEITEIYNNIPRVLARKAIKVAPTNNQYLDNSQKQIFLTETQNSNYWIITTEDNISCLLPKNNLIINTFNLDTVKSLFNCEGSEQLENREFTLTEPAKISLMPNGKKWQLEEKGTLNFDPNFPKIKLRSQLEQANQKCQQLQSQLIEKEKERQQLTSQVAQLASDQLQEIRSHLVTKKELDKHLQQINNVSQQLQEKLVAFIQQKFQEEHSSFQSNLNKLEERLKETIERVHLLEKLEEEHQQFNSKIQESVEEQQKIIKCQLEKLASEHIMYSQFFTSINEELEKIKTDKSQLKSELSFIFSRLNTQLQHQLTSFKTDSEKQLQSQLSQIKSNTDNQIHLLQTRLEDIEDYLKKIKTFFDNLAGVNSATNIQESPSKDNQVNAEDTTTSQSKSEISTKYTLNWEEYQYLEEYQLVKQYNNDLSTLSTRIIEVVETQKSISDRSLARSQIVILEEKSRGIYGILSLESANYLVPSKNFRITDNNYKTVEALFECRGYQKGYSEDFRLLKPARVSSRSSNKQWQLQERGILEF